MEKIPEISKAMEELWAEVNILTSRIGNQAAMAKPDSKVWSISEEFGHMILSAGPIAKVLNLGYEQFQNQALPPRKALSYSGLEDLYWEILGNQNVLAPSRYISDQDNPPSFDEQQQKWTSIGHGLIVGLELWSEEKIDAVQLKHPLLKYLTLREMLFFTHIHTTHHFNSLHRKASLLSRLN